MPSNIDTDLHSLQIILSVDGRWGAWGAWSTVNTSTGLVTRTRQCNNPSPLNGGQTCPGSATSTEQRPGKRDWRKISNLKYFRKQLLFIDYIY